MGRTDRTGQGAWPIWPVFPFLVRHPPYPHCMVLVNNLGINLIQSYTSLALPQLMYSHLLNRMLRCG